MDERNCESQQQEQPRLVNHLQLQATQKQHVLPRPITPRYSPVDTLGIDTAGGFGLAEVDDPTLDV